MHPFSKRDLMSGSRADNHRHDHMAVILGADHSDHTRLIRSIQTECDASIADDREHIGQVPGIERDLHLRTIDGGIDEAVAVAALRRAADTSTTPGSASPLC